MFGLAFIYTKYSLNDSGKKHGGEVFFTSGSRAPSSVDEVAAVVPAMKRVPASVLYKNLEDAEFLGPFKGILNFRGTIIGYPHVESFGFVVDDKGRSTFSVSDYPEASEGAYLHDVLAHLVSAKTADKKILWINYFDAYKAGLQDQPHIYSYYVENGLENAIWDTQKAFEENVSNDDPFEFTALKKSSHRVNVAQKNAIQKSLKRKFSKIQFFDLYQSDSDSKTFQVLVRMRPQDKIQWLELHENSICDYDQTFNQETKSIPFEKRLELIRSDIFDGRLDKSLHSVLINKKYFTMKFSDQFAAKLLLGKIPVDDYQDIALDEAYVLGKIHRKTLGEKTDDYIKAWASIPGAVVDEKMIELKYRLKDLQE